MNVLVYVMDALRADFCSCYGHEYETTPELDAFAEDAVRYENAYTTATWTKPAATSLLTGRQPRAVNAMGLLDELPPLSDTLPRALGEAGVSTRAVSTNTFVAEEFGFTDFDEFTHLQKDPTTQQRRRTAESRGSEDEVTEELGIDRKVIPLSADINDVLFDHYETVEPGEDTFVLAWSIDTHGPYFVRGEESAFGNDPDEVVRESEVSAANLDRVRSLYRDMIRYNDRQFGLLLEKLREEGLYDETLVVCCADHGESFGDHTKFLDWPIIGHSGVVYEEVINVPLLVKFPEDGAHEADFNTDGIGGGTVERPVQLTDVYPTVADLFGFETPETLQGESLRPDEGATEERTIFVESQPTAENVYSAALRRGDEKLLQIHKEWQWRRDPRRMVESLLWKFAVPSTQLFDLGIDPDERSDLADDRPGTVDELRSELEATRDSLERASDTVADESATDVGDDTERHLEALGYLE
jgi:arylsulfatase A-like enzyme